MPIDWPWIATLEGGQRLAGYVPAADASQSGVTIATGFDLGQRTEADLLHLPDALGIKLSPYLQVRGRVAAEYLRAHPLTVTKAEADMLDAISQRDVTHLLRIRLAGFDHMPAGVQTISASVSLQYGDIRQRCPRLFALLSARDWHGVIEELDDFGDAYTTRRHKERDYLKAHLT